ncbi:secreted RxLR effector protein 161-like [Cryptomeria japonica]|uniref:secreted RxLR effector protein 161-like n=1 Tax=Cryptomeria japonica TaxID=3369 RepID=UPI0027DA0B7C|nr:secreted RxLR effector protein 161-like [Cryptomeria japonica]
MEKGLKLSAKADSLAVDEIEFRQLVGSLIYLTATRPDICFAVSYISRFMTAPKADHWIAAKPVLRYVKGTSDYGILYGRCNDPKLIGYTDLDWAGSVDDRKSTSWYVFRLGTSVVTWSSKKQRIVALSSTEAEYRGTVKAACETVWLRRMLSDMQMPQAKSSLKRGAKYFKLRGVTYIKSGRSQKAEEISRNGGRRN